MTTCKIKFKSTRPLYTNVRIKAEELVKDEILGLATFLKHKAPHTVGSRSKETSNQFSFVQPNKASTMKDIKL